MTLASSRRRPSAAGALANTGSTAASTGSVERNERLSGTSFQTGSIAHRLGAERRARSRRSGPDRRPGSCRSTASRRRPRTGCGFCSLAPSPAKNSSARRSMIDHCSGLVSCASSTRMWSMPPSILNSTHAAAPARDEQRLRLDDQVVIVEHGLALFGALILRLDGIGEQEHRSARLGASELRALQSRACRSGLARASSSGAKLRLRLPQVLAAHGSWRGLSLSVRKIGFNAATRPRPSPLSPPASRSRSSRSVRCSRRCRQALRAARRSRSSVSTSARLGKRRVARRRRQVRTGA